MSGISFIEPFDLSLSQVIKKPGETVTRQRSVACRNLSSFDDMAKGLFCVAAVSESLRRLKTPTAINLNIGQHILGWSDPSGISSSYSGETAVAHLAKTAGEAVADAFVVYPEGTDAPAGTLLVEYGFSDDVARFQIVAPKDWGRTISPDAELDALVEMLSAIFADIVQSPHLRVADASAISDQARQFALGPLAGRAADFGEFKPLPMLLQDCTKANSDRVAYVFKTTELSFSDFEARANGMAHMLQELGVKKGDVIPVMFVNGLEMPVAYYALMKAGAALVPIDFEWPEDRQKATLGQFDSDLILTSENVTVPDRFKPKQKIIRLSEIPLRGETVSVSVEPEDPIYGFFTSGTTGVPKCALNNNGALFNRFYAMNRFLGNIGGAVLQNTRYMYDSSIGHMFFALTQGFPVVLPEDGKALELHYIVEMIDKHDIVMTDFVPSVLNQMISMVENNPDAQSKLQSLRELIVGGEQITPKMVQKMRSFLSPELRISNCYGITETAIGLTYHPVTDDDGMHIPLGRPLDNCFLMIVDDAMRPLPRGGIGQIMVGGACIGNGYMNNPERTRQVFLPNPFPEIPGDTLYATGDNGYFDAQGELEFIGRRDFITKVSGVLIEPAEIETAAESLESVHQSRAFVYDDGRDGAIALLAVGEANLEKSKLRSHLKSKLPKGLMPRHILILPEMPLADSGKLDQKRLQSVMDLHLDEQRAHSGAGSKAPKDELTVRICDIFSEVLSGVSIAPDTNFFDAGGDSLLAIQVALKAEKQFSVALSVSELIANPEPAKIARRISTLLRQGAKPRPIGEDIERDVCVLAKEFPKTYPTAKATKPRQVLLTGATGFVGGYFARQLLRDPEIHTVALGRGGGDRLEENMKSKGLWESDFEPRLTHVNGDLSQPLLGLDEMQFQTLAEECDAILHCGAFVNFAYDYQTHRGANVFGTATLLEFAGRGLPKAFHHISTMGVLGGDIPNAFVSPVVNELPVPTGGYSQSKLAAERLITEAGRRGLAAKIYRLGEIMPDALGGRPNEAALTNMLLSSFSVFECVPDVPILTDWTPVCSLADRIVTSVTNGIEENTTSHEFADVTVDLTMVFEMAGYAFERVAPKDWLARLDAQISDAPTRALLSLRNMLSESTSADGAEVALSGLFNPPYLQTDSSNEIFGGSSTTANDIKSSIQNYAERLVEQNKAAPKPLANNPQSKGIRLTA